MMIHTDSPITGPAATTRRAHLGLTAAALILTAGLTLTWFVPTTQAVGTCPAGQFCYYYGENMSGSMAAFTASTPSLADRFTSPGDGEGQSVRTNARSVCNNTGQDVTVYAAGDYAGALQVIAPSVCRNLNVPLADNAGSHRIGATPLAPADVFKRLLAALVMAVGIGATTAMARARREATLPAGPVPSESEWPGDVNLGAFADAVRTTRDAARSELVGIAR